jgi:hypothetical protein
MSLVNDALKRAKAAQKSSEPPAAAGPALRPADPHPGTRLGVGITVPAIFALLALIGLFWVWRNAQTAFPTSAAARTPAAVPAPGSADAGADLSSDSTLRSHVKNEVTTLPAGLEALPGTTGKEAGPVAFSPLTPEPPGAIAAPAATRTAPAPLRLQAIFYEPSQPSAMIRGKTVMVGDTVEHARVVAITDTSVTLVDEGRTNILTLP